MKILIVEDDAATRRGSSSSSSGPLETWSVGTPRRPAALENFAPNLCIVDLMLPDGDGPELDPRGEGSDPAREFVVLTGRLDRTAVEAMKAGAPTTS
jgi:DNA-binding NtrC family response regulator